MKRALFLLMITLMFGTAFAQPKQRRVQKSEQQQQSETESAEEPFFFDVCACPDILPYGSGYARRGGVAP